MKPFKKNIFAKNPDPMPEEGRIMLEGQILPETFSQNYYDRETVMRLFSFRTFNKLHCWAMFVNGGQHLQSILKSTGRKPSKVRRMTNTSTMRALVFFHGILMFFTSTCSKLSCIRR